VASARRTIRFTGGITAAFNPADGHVQVGDRWVPPRIVVQSQTANEPDLKMTIEVRHGIPVCTEFVLRARPDGPDVRKRDLQLPLDDWVDRIVAACSMRADTVDESSRWTMLVQPIEDPEAFADVRRTRVGRPRISREHLEQVAEIYRTHFDDRPTDAVRRAFGLTESTADRRIKAARNAGLLPPTTPGKKKV